MKIGVRVDASAQIGTGHLRRCLSLAHALRALGGDVRFVTRDLGFDSATLIASQGFEHIAHLPAPLQPALPSPDIPLGAWAEVPLEQDVADTIEALHAFAPDWMLLNSYAFDAHWHDGVRQALGCKIAQIDDVPDRKIASDLLIDHNYSASHSAKYADCLLRKTTILGGPRFALLDPIFATAERYVFSKSVRSVGVFMGGIDSGNHSVVALEALASAGFNGKVEVVSTTANPNLDALRACVNSRPETALSLDLPNLAGFFARHDLQIGAGGGATWERCCIGVPSLLVVVAANQNAVVPLLAAQKVVALASEPSREAIARQLVELFADAEQRRTLGNNSREMVDGHGAMRVALAMLAQTLCVRPATAADAQMMFDWRGDEAIRAVSLQSGALEWHRHLAWLDRALENPACKLFVGEIGGRPVGVIRFDFASEARAEVSLYLDPALHGLGLGPRLLLAGEETVGARIIEATVLSGNRPSQRLFERCGYQLASSDQWIKQHD